MSQFIAVPPGSSLDNPILTDAVGSDEVLQAIVATADDDSGFSVSMTVAANGCLVTGLLIGEPRFFQELEIQHAELRESLTTPFRKRFVDERDTADTDPFQCRYVHLKDARYLTGAGFAPQPNSTGFFWRGRIAHVSAWSFGAIGPSPSPSV